MFNVRGRNECPKDFESYWQRALSEMRGTGTEFELEPAGPKLPFAECFEMWFTGTGGARIHARLARPKLTGCKMPLVLRFHGYSQAAGDFASLLSWTAAGFCCAVLDCRGQGGYSEDNLAVVGNTLHGHIIRGLSEQSPDRLYYRNVFLDTVQLADILASQPWIDASRIGAYGASQGGGLTIACAALSDKISRAAFQMPFLCDYRMIWENGYATDAYLELQQYFRRFDPQHKHENELFTRLGYIDAHNLAKKITCPVRMYTGLMDSTCPPCTQFAAYNNISAPKSVQFYYDFWHEEYYPGQPDDLIQFMMKMPDDR